MIFDMRDEQRGGKGADDLRKQNAHQQAGPQRQQGDIQGLQHQNERQMSLSHAQNVIQCELCAPAQDEDAVGIQHEHRQDHRHDRRERVHHLTERIQQLRDAVGKIIQIAEQLQRTAGVETVKQADGQRQRQKIEQVVMKAGTDVFIGELMIQHHRLPTVSSHR